MTINVYDVFDLLVQPSSNGYQARVIQSPVGQAVEPFTLTFARDELRRFFWVGGASLRKLRLGDEPAPVPLTPQQFGERLFNIVFTGQVGQCFVRSMDAAKREGKGLRIRLRLNDVPELASLPWEYLYSSSPKPGFLALSDATPIVRYLELAQEERPLKVLPPLRVLAVVSNPQDVTPLEVEKEWARLQDALTDLQSRQLIHLERVDPPTPVALQRRLRDKATGDVHILHFIGHGAYDEVRRLGGLYFENEDGKHHFLAAQDLAIVLQDHDALRLLFLNACEGARGGQEDLFTGTAQTLVQQGMPAVLAMQFPVGDAAAIALCHEFYRALAAGMPVEACVGEARKVIKVSGNEIEWGTPVLFSRATDGHVLEFPKSSPQEIVDDIASKAVDFILRGNATRFIECFDHLCLLGAGKLLDNDSWRKIVVWQTIITDPAVAADGVLQQVLIDDPSTTVSAILTRMDNLPSASHTRLLAAIRETGIESKLEANFLMRFLDARDRIEQVKLFRYKGPVPPTPLNIRQFDTGREHRMKLYLDRYDPFRYSQAEAEDLWTFRPTGLFWDQHRCMERISAANGPLVICGMAGTGKTALANACFVRLTDTNFIKNATLVVQFGSLLSPDTMAELASHHLLAVLATNIDSLRVFTEDQFSFLADFFIATLGKERTIFELDRICQQSTSPQSTGRNKTRSSYHVVLIKMLKDAGRMSQTDSKSSRLNDLNHIAQSIGFKGSKLLLDNANEPLHMTQIDNLLNIQHSGMNVVLLTSNHEVLDQLSLRAFSAEILKWQPAELHDMLWHRLVHMNLALLRQDVMVDQLPESRHHFLEAIFDQSGLTSLKSLQFQTPRQWMQLMSLLLTAQPLGSKYPKITAAEIDSIAGTISA